MRSIAARRRVRRALPGRRVGALVALLAAGLLIAPATSQAEPDRLQGQLDDARARLDALVTQAENAIEDHAEAVAELEAAEAEVAAVRDELAAVGATIDEHRSVADRFARRLYQLGPAYELEALVSAEGPTDATNGAVALRKVTERQIATVHELRTHQATAAQLEQRLAVLRDRAAEQARRAEQLRASAEATVAAQRGEVAQLQRQLEAQERREREEAARREREAAARAAAQRAAEEAARAAERARAAAAPAPATRRSAQVAVDAAVSQVGKPYRWGGSGPDAYDCSGLTSWAWRHAGVSLSHSSRAQYRETRRISRGDLSPGDLVFFGSPIHHVAMYIGNGKVVEAPYSGERVRINASALSRSDIVGYGRP